jgi:hypothetical protein
LIRLTAIARRLDRFKPRRATAARQSPDDLRAAPRLRFRALHEGYSFTADDGKQIWASGYTLLDDAIGTYIKLHEQHFENPHCLLCRIAGTSHRPKALQDARFAPGSALVLRLAPDNPYDSNAISVWDASGTTQIGFVPAQHSARIAADIRSGSPLGGLIMREFRRSKDGKRLGLHMLIAPTGVLEFALVEDFDDHYDQDSEDDD